MISDTSLYIIDGAGCQHLFDADRLKCALSDAFAASGDPDAYLAEDIALAVEAAMSETARSEQIFTQSEVNAAVIRILENAGCPGTAHTFQRTNSHFYVAVDVREEEAKSLIERHLGVTGKPAEQLSNQVVEALRKLGFQSAAPALYLELARHYEQVGNPAEILMPQPEVPAGKLLLNKSEAALSLTGELRMMVEKGILELANVSRLYPNFRLSLDMGKLADELQLIPPVPEMLLIAKLDRLGEAAGQWLRVLAHHLADRQLPLYLVLVRSDVFVTQYLEADYPAGKSALLDLAGVFRAALDYPVKKIRCRTGETSKGPHSECNKKESSVFRN